MRMLRVTAPYVTLKVLGDDTAWTLRGFLADAVVPADRIDAKSLRHHVDSELAEEFEVAEPEPTAPVGPSRPAGNASREAWAEHAAAQGAPEEETRPVDEGGLSRDDLRSKYGN